MKFRIITSLTMLILGNILAVIGEYTAGVVVITGAIVLIWQGIK